MKYILKPLQEPFSDFVSAVFEKYPKGKDGYIIQLFRVFANSDRFLKGKGIVGLLDKESPLSIREREIVILRVTANLNCEYEWGVHVTAFSKAAELDDKQILATRLSAADADCWPVREQLLLKSVDDLCSNAQIQMPNYDNFQNTWNLEQQLEIFALCGNYHTVSFIANTTRLIPEDTSAKFPLN